MSVAPGELYIILEINLYTIPRCFMCVKLWFPIISDLKNTYNSLTGLIVSKYCERFVFPEGSCRIYAPLNWAVLGSGNGLSPARRQAIIWTNDDILSIGFPVTNFSETWIKIHQFLSRKNSWKCRLRDSRACPRVNDFKLSTCICIMDYNGAPD